jgi:hypothetical protein
VTRKLRLLEAQMDTVRGNLNMTGPKFQDELHTGIDYEGPLLASGVNLESSTAVIPASIPNGSATRPPRTWEMRLDPDSGPAAIPASCVEEVTDCENKSLATSTARPDCITQGLLTLSQATTLFDIYAHRLDHYLYRILGESPSLDQIRLNSPLLTTAICTVGALHSRELGFVFDRCQKAFLQQCAALLFLKSTNIDDIRGLCIGAFWLHEVSPQLVGLGMNFY